MFKTYFKIGIILLGYVTFAYYLFSPFNFKHFSLIDDGQLVKYGKYLRGCVLESKCLEFRKEIVESLPDVSLSRSGAWLLYGISYQDGLVDPLIQHSFRVYFLGGIMVLLMILVFKQLQVDLSSSIVGVAIYVTTYSFAENMIRLGPIEPYLVIFIAIVSYLLISRYINKNSILNTILLTLVLSFYVLIKEVSIAIFPAIIFYIVTSKNTQKVKDILFFVAIPVIIYLFAKGLFSLNVAPSLYASNYSLDIVNILSNPSNYLNMLSNSLGIYLFIFFSLLPFLFFKYRINIQANKNLFFWMIMFVSFTVIMFPWKFVLDRYMLPAVFSFSIAFALLLNKVFVLYKKYVPIKYWPIAYIVFAIINTNIYFSFFKLNYPRTINYREWYTVYTQYEHDIVHSLSKLDGEFYINASEGIENWELLYEIPMHLDYFYGKRPGIKLYDDTSQVGYVLSASTLYSELDIKESGEDIVNLDGNDYQVGQIDVDKYRRDFISNPLKYILYPPFEKKYYTYSWKVDQIK